MIKYLNTNTESILGWKSKGVYNTRLIPIKNDSLPNIEYLKKKIALQFNDNSLVVEQNICTSRIVNIFTVNDLDTCLFGATNVVKNSDKEKYVYGGYGIAFDGKSLWRFSDEFAWNVIISGIGNGSSSHTDNPKNNLLILGGGDTFCINGSFGEPEIKKSINFTKAKTKFF